MIKQFFQSFFITCVMTTVAFLMLNITSAQVRSSTNYQLQSDSINIGGGYSSSTSYTQESTVGEIATGYSTSTNYQLRAGYQQMQESSISLSVSGNVVMTPDLPGLTGGESNGSTTITVTTDSPSGYQLLIQAEDDPAMQRDGGGASIADYSPVGIVPDYGFSTGASDAHLGFSPEGIDVVQAFLDDGGSCNAGSNSGNCWDGLDTATNVISSGSSSNHPNGATTTINFRVGLGSSAGVLSGVYTATSTVTALPL